MKMLNCPECGLTITDAQKECPKCRTKIEDLDIDELVRNENSNKKGSKKKNSKKPGNNKIKEEMIEAVIRAEEAVSKASLRKDASVQEELIAAVVEAEALAAIEEETNAENFCKNCKAPISRDQSLCQACISVKPAKTSSKRVVPKTDEETSRFLAAIGYVFFFVPLIVEYYRESAFVKFHAKQATALFVFNTILFLILAVLRNRLDYFALSHIDTISAILNINFNPLEYMRIPWHRGHATGGFYYHYLTWMIYLLHLLPFVLMIMGIVNAARGKVEQLPLIRFFIKDEKDDAAS